ncbi:MAG: ribbon-helix-helix protein, CopG family, partial [Terriglobales bacterium]
MATRITVTVDDETAARLKRAAARTGKSKSASALASGNPYTGASRARRRGAGFS